MIGGGIGDVLELLLEVVEVLRLFDTGDGVDCVETIGTALEETLVIGVVAEILEGVLTRHHLHILAIGCI